MRKTASQGFDDSIAKLASMRRAALLLVVAAIAPVPGRAMHPTASPVVYAHRGGAGIAPENTLGAFRTTHAAYGDAGVWLELDVQLAADGELVVIHDASLDRTTDCAGNVVAKTSAQLAACDAAEAWPGWGFEPVPTLRDVLLEGKEAGWRLMPEIKNIPGEPNFDPVGTAAATRLVELLTETSFPAERVIVQSFFPTSLDHVELGAPSVATSLLTASEYGFLLTENALFATGRGYEISSPDHEAADLRVETVSLAHALGREVVVWTVDDPARIAVVAALGVDGIISNRPDRVYELLGHH